MYPVRCHRSLDSDEKSWLAPSSGGSRVIIQADGAGGDLLMRGQASEQVNWQPPSTTDHPDNVVVGHICAVLANQLYTRQQLVSAAMAARCWLLSCVHSVVRSTTAALHADAAS
jgi:hypothetical protein